MKSRIRIAPAIALAALALSPRAGASEEAYAKMMECLKLPAASPQQDACVGQVKQMTAASPKPKSAPAAARQTAAPPAAKSMAAPPPGAKQAVAAPPVPAEVKQAAATLAVNGSSVSGIGSAGANISGMDLETAMMVVQTQRANLLEAQLKGQLEAIQKRNEEIARLNQQLLAELRTNRPGDPATWGALGKDRKAAQDLLASLNALGLTIPAGAVKEVGTPGVPSAKQFTFDKWTEELKGKIDSLNNSQQMDMLRMQSLTNKRNEAFDVMTNFIKKMADSRSSVLGNMR